MPNLTHKTVENAKQKQKTYLLPDGNGLNLQVNPNGNKYWIFRYRFANKEKRMSLGAIKKISLQQARLLTMDCHKCLASSVDPGIKRRKEKTEQKESEKKIFKVIAEEWYQGKVKANMAESSLEDIRRYLKKDIYPAIGDKPIDTITRKDCIKIQEAIQQRGALSKVSFVNGCLNAIFTQAIVKELCDSNPAMFLTCIAIPKPKSKPYSYLLEHELPDFLRALFSKSTSCFEVNTAVWMTLLTASRPGTVSQAEWKEINFETASWLIPAEKMKSRRPHTVPICSQLMVRLKQLYQLSGHKQFLFCGFGSKKEMINRSTILNSIENIGYKGKMTAHGSRHTASTLLREHLWYKDFVESQLAHKEKGIAGIYNQAIYLKYRTQMMQWYADYLDALREGLTDELANDFERRRVQTLYGISQVPILGLSTSPPQPVMHSVLDRA